MAPLERVPALSTEPSRSPSRGGISRDSSARFRTRSRSSRRATAPATDSAMTTNHSSRYLHDQPLTDPTHDRLHRSDFADRVADILHHRPKGFGLVLGVYGAWGEGKTTVLNLLRVNLAKNNTLIVRTFNPWRLPDEDALFRGFFSMLSEAVGASLSAKLRQATTAAAKCARYARLITAPLGLVSKPAESLDGLLARFGQAAGAGDALRLDELRNRILPHLRESQKTIVILLDDIDRLDKRETHTLFRLIKACADLPNVCYVLAFDDKAVSRALGEQYGSGDESSGRAFLEKIIQVPLTLPVAAKEDLRALCFERVNQALDAAGIQLTDAQLGEFIAAFDRSASVRLATPRAANRYANGLLFALPTLAGESHPVDHLLVEALRAFFPHVYEIVRENHSDFSGIEDDPRTRGDTIPRASQLLDPILDKLPADDANAVKALIMSLFPRLRGIYGKTSYGRDWLSSWSRDRRICSPEYCPRYFAYTIPRDDIPDAAIAALLETANHGSAAEVEAHIANWLDQSKAGRLIEKLRASEKIVSPPAAETLSHAIARIGDRLPNPRTFAQAAAPPTQAALLVSHLLRRIPDPTQRISAGRHAIQSAQPLWFAAECLRWFHVSDKPQDEDVDTYSTDTVSDMRSVLVERIKSDAAHGAPLFDPDVPQQLRLLFDWRRATSRDEVGAHLLKVFRGDPPLVFRFLISFAPRGWSAGSVTPHIADLTADRLSDIEYIVDLDTLVDFIRKNCAGDFDNPDPFGGEIASTEQRLTAQFLFLVKQRKRKSESSAAADDNATNLPDSPGDTTGSEPEAR